MRNVAPMTNWGTQLSDSDTQHHLTRMLSSGFALAVIVVGTICLGILRTPGEVAAVVSDPVGFVSLWVVSGLFILLSLVVVAELIGMTPRLWWRFPGRLTGPYALQIELNRGPGGFLITLHAQNLSISLSMREETY